MSDQRGFNLIEVMVAAAIITTLATGLFATYTFSTKMRKGAEEGLTAAEILARKVAELQNIGPVNLSVTAEPYPDCLTPPLATECTVTHTTDWGLEGVIRTVVKQPAGVTQLDRKYVYLTFHWTGFNGVQKVKEAASYIFEA